MTATQTLHAALSELIAKMGSLHWSHGECWQPIALAPRDQVNILGSHENSKIQKVCWRTKAGSEFYEFGCGQENVWKPTHWRPLPLPPEPPQ